MKDNNISLYLPNEGICNGLSLLHATYFLQGREDKFFKKIHAILHPENIKKTEIDAFFMELIDKILILQKPHDFISGKSQVYAADIIDENTTSSFNFYMVGNDIDWVKVFQEISLDNNEIIKVSSINHAITISKKEGQYRIYDPNYHEGIKSFESEEKLITELREIVFSYRDKNLGLHLQILCDKKSQKKRDELAFYKKYITSENMNHLAITKKGKEFHTMCSSAVCDEKIIRYLLQLGSDYTYKSLFAAVQGNNDKVIPLLLENLHANLKKTTRSIHDDKSQMKQYETINSLLKEDQNVVNDAIKAQLKLANDALLLGSDKAFKALILNIPKNLLEKMASHYILSAAYGGNLELLKDVMKIKKEAGPSLFSILQNAIKGRRLEIVNDLIQEESPILTQEEKMKLLMSAIQENNYSIVKTLLHHEETKFSLRQLSLSVNMIKKLDVPLLKALKKAGMTFTSLEEAIISKKDHKPIGRIESLGIIFLSFADFIKRKALKQNFFLSCRAYASDDEDLKHSLLQKSKDCST